MILGRQRPSAATAAFIDSLGTGLIMSLTVLFFSLTTDIPLGQIGLAVATAGFVALPLGMVGGWICDRYDSRVAMVVNNLLAASGYALYLVANNLTLVFLGFLLVAVGDRIYWAAWTAYVHDLSAGRPYEQLFARLESAKMAAMGTGAVVAAVVLATSAATGARWLVIANVGLTVAASFAYARIPMPPSLAGTTRTSDEQAPPIERTHLLRQRGFWSITAGQLFLAPIMVLPNVALSVFFVTVWGMNPAVAAVLFGINAGLVALLQERASYLARHTARATLIALACGALVVALVVLALLPPIEGIEAWTVVTLVGIVLAVADMLYMPATNALMAEVPSPAVRGLSISIFQTAMAVGMALYPALMGLLTAHADLLWVLTSASIMLGAAGYAVAAMKAPVRVRVAEGRAAT